MWHAYSGVLVESFKTCILRNIKVIEACFQVAYLPITQCSGCLCCTQIHIARAIMKKRWIKHWLKCTLTTVTLPNWLSLHHINHIHKDICDKALDWLIFKHCVHCYLNSDTTGQNVYNKHLLVITSDRECEWSILIRCCVAHLTFCLPIHLEPSACKFCSFDGRSLRPLIN